MLNSIFQFLAIAALLLLVAFWPYLAICKSVALRGDRKGVRLGVWLVAGFFFLVGCHAIFSSPLAPVPSHAGAIPANPIYVAAMCWWWALVTLAGAYGPFSVIRSR